MANHKPKIHLIRSGPDTAGIARRKKSHVLFCGCPTEGVLAVRDPDQASCGSCYRSWKKKTGGLDAAQPREGKATDGGCFARFYDGITESVASPTDVVITKLGDTEIPPRSLHRSFLASVSGLRRRTIAEIVFSGGNREPIVASRVECSIEIESPKGARWIVIDPTFFDAIARVIEIDPDEFERSADCSSSASESLPVETDSRAPLRAGEEYPPLPPKRNRSR